MDVSHSHVLTLAEAAELASGRLENQTRKPEDWIVQHVRGGKLKVIPPGGRTVYIRDETIFNFRDSTVSTTRSLQTRAIDDDYENAAYQSHTESHSVLIDRAELESLLPAKAPLTEPLGPPKGQPGRKQKWDWDGAGRYLMEVANSPDGLPEVQARVEDLVKIWFADHFADEPSDSMVRDFVSNRLPNNHPSRMRSGH